MKIQINGEERDFPDAPAPFTLAALVGILGMKPKGGQGQEYSKRKKRSGHSPEGEWFPRHNFPFVTTELDGFCRIQPARVMSARNSGIPLGC